MSNPAITNGSFEQPGATAAYNNPTPTGWTLQSNGGSADTALSGAGIGPFSPNSGGSGSTNAFIQKSGSFAQVVNFGPGGTFTLSLVSCGRQGDQGTNPLAISIDGAVVATVTPPGFGSGVMQPTTTPQFTAGPNTHTLMIQGTNPGGGDSSTLFDSLSLNTVSLNLAPSAAPTVLPSTPVGTLGASPTAGSERISYGAITAGTNPVAGVYIYVGSASGMEGTNPVNMNAGGAAGYFDQPIGGNVYTLRAADTASPPNFSATSAEITGGSAPAGGVTFAQVQQAVANQLAAFLGTLTPLLPTAAHLKLLSNMVAGFAAAPNPTDAGTQLAFTVLSSDAPLSLGQVAQAVASPLAPLVAGAITIPATAFPTAAPSGWFTPAALGSGTANAIVAGIQTINLPNGIVAATPVPTATSFSVAATGSALSTIPGAYGGKSILFQTGPLANYLGLTIATQTYSAGNGYQFTFATPLPAIPVAGNTFVITG